MLPPCARACLTALMHPPFFPLCTSANVLHCQRAVCPFPPKPSILLPHWLSPPPPWGGYSTPSHSRGLLLLIHGAQQQQLLLSWHHSPWSCESRNPLTDPTMTISLRSTLTPTLCHVDSLTLSYFMSHVTLWRVSAWCDSSFILTLLFQFLSRRENSLLG